MAERVQGEQGMRSVRIVDTSVFCELLRVPEKSSPPGYKRAVGELERAIKAGDSLLLPMATVYETGNHIGQGRSGRRRRSAARRFVDQVRKAIDGDSPFSPMRIHQANDVRRWLDEFPDCAMRGMGLGDLSIVHLYEQQLEFHRRRRVLIWSYDKHLQGYDSSPKH